MQVISDIKGFVITSWKEKERAANINKLQAQLPQMEFTPAIYPTEIHVPFLQKLMECSKARTGTALNQGEIGVLLSHRRIWQEICKRAVDETENYLVLESDSILLNISLLKNYFYKSRSWDIFFWGAWSGHMQLYRSSIQAKIDAYRIGEPYIRTIYGAYGYSLNRKAAHLLLKRTARIAYPVDQYKRFFTQNELKIGGVVPEVISYLDFPTTVGHEGVVMWKRKLLLRYLWIRNKVICFFK